MSVLTVIKYTQLIMQVLMRQVCQRSPVFVYLQVVTRKTQYVVVTLVKLITLVLLLPGSVYVSMAGLFITGLGSEPLFPNFSYLTLQNFVAGAL